MVVCLMLSYAALVVLLLLAMGNWPVTRFLLSRLPTPWVISCFSFYVALVRGRFRSLNLLFFVRVVISISFFSSLFDIGIVLATPILCAGAAPEVTSSAIDYLGSFGDMLKIEAGHQQCAVYNVPKPGYYLPPTGFPWDVTFYQVPDLNNPLATLPDDVRAAVIRNPARGLIPGVDYIVNRVLSRDSSSSSSSSISTVSPPETPRVSSLANNIPWDLHSSAITVIQGCMPDLTPLDFLASPNPHLPFIHPVGQSVEDITVGYTASSPDISQSITFSGQKVLLHSSSSSPCFWWSLLSSSPVGDIGMLQSSYGEGIFSASCSLGDAGVLNSTVSPGSSPLEAPPCFSASISSDLEEIRVVPRPVKVGAPELSIDSSRSTSGITPTPRPVCSLSCSHVYKACRWLARKVFLCRGCRQPRGK